jgi:hypothetical protein
VGQNGPVERQALFGYLAAASRFAVNVHALPNGLRAAVQVLEARDPITIIGILPRGSAVHVPDGSAVDLLAKKRPGLSLLAVAQAEADFAKELGRPVGIVLTSGVRGEEAARLTAAARPL